jgi:hypothetical protein
MVAITALVDVIATHTTTPVLVSPAKKNLLPSGPMTSPPVSKAPIVVWPIKEFVVAFIIETPPSAAT